MAVYALTIFLSAFLLFQVQPIIAKYILPWFGGTPAVWSTCMLFFQVLLLGGYAYAHWLSSRLRPRRQGSLHLAVIAATAVLLVLLGLAWKTPITPGVNWKAQGSAMPVLNIVLLLSVSVGFPFFVLSTTGPLLQRWFSLRYPGRSPYRLFALSNAGSLAALLSYPFIIEPALGLRTQAWTWSAMYFVYAAACICLAVGARQLRVASDESSGPKEKEGNEKSGDTPEWKTKLLWVLLAAGASIMLLAVTNQLCQEVAVIPFLWVLPLSVYLVTFIICFGHERWYSRWYVLAFPVAAYYMWAAMNRGWELPILRQIVIYSIGLFAFCMVCHGELARRKPHAKHLTSFYLCVSIGGAIGGVFVALISPRIFNGYWELHVGIIFCFALVLWSMHSIREQSETRWGRLLAFVLFCLCLIMVSNGVYAYGWTLLEKVWNLYVALVAGAVLALCFVFRRKESILARRIGLFAYIGLAVVLGMLSFQLYMNYRFMNGRPLLATRNFFGVLRVERIEGDKSEGERYQLIHGATVHGMQFSAPEKRELPLTYFSPSSGVGRALRYHPKRTSGGKGSLRIGDVGLGIGTIASAAYAMEGDYYRFYEINPSVSPIALGKGDFFTYIPDCPAKVDIVIGDGRLSLERELDEHGSMRFDVLVLDAFNSDAVPVHLLTVEAFKMYLRHLEQDGIIVVNITNRVLRLDPVVWKMAEHLGLEAVHITSDGLYDEGGALSSWMLLARDKQVLDGVLVGFRDRLKRRAKRRPEDLDKYSLWTDNYSNLFKYLK